MDEHITRALRIDRSSTVADRRVDITTTGARTGRPRRVEIWLYRAAGQLYLTGRPGPRAWYANLLSQPRFTLHLKGKVTADLPARAVAVTGEAERRRIFTELLGDINGSDAIPHPNPRPTVEDWLAGSPLVEIHLVDAP
jgi:deazaflavin-dependent oxidoreductase (nitroreductase family)